MQNQDTFSETPSVLFANHTLLCILSLWWIAEKSVSGLAHFNQNPYSPAFHLHVYGSSPQSESLEQAILEEGLRVSYKTIFAIISQLCRAARKVSPNWSQKTMTCHSFNCFRIVWGQG